MNYVITLVCALVGAFIFERMQIPAGALVGGMIGVVVVRLGAGYLVDLPSPARFVVYALVGWLLGQTVDRETLAALRPVAMPMVMAIGALLVIGGLLALGLAWFGIVDPRTAFLAVSPGGLVQMSAVGGAVGANVPVVIAVHVLRLTSVVLIAPLVVRALPGQ